MLKPLDRQLVWFYGTSTIVGYLMPDPFLYVYTVYFKQFSFIWPIDRILSGATTPGQSGPESSGK